MSKTGQWIMDLQEESWDKVAECIRDCDHEQEAQIAALKIFEASGLLGNYLDAHELEDGVSEMWHEHCSSYA